MKCIEWADSQRKEVDWWLPKVGQLREYKVSANEQDVSYFGDGQVQNQWLGFHNFMNILKTLDYTL